jgi:hypothetical protein
MRRKSGRTTKTLEKQPKARGRPVPCSPTGEWRTRLLSRPRPPTCPNRWSEPQHRQAVGVPVALGFMRIPLPFLVQPTAERPHQPNIRFGPSPHSPLHRLPKSPHRRRCVGVSRARNRRRRRIHCRCQTRHRRARERTLHRTTTGFACGLPTGLATDDALAHLHAARDAGRRRGGWRLSLRGSFLLLLLRSACPSARAASSVEGSGEKEEMSSLGSPNSAPLALLQITRG